MQTWIKMQNGSPLPVNDLRIEIRPGLWLDQERALYIEAKKMLVIADIHWGYADSHRRQGNLLPMWGNEETSQRLRALLVRYAPQRMVWLGDSLHTPKAAASAEEFLDELPDSLEVIIIRGNHDRTWPRAHADEFRMAGYTLHHGDRDLPVEEGITEIIGHIHPAFSWHDGAGTRLKVPVLVEEANRLILPAFSDWSAGATWNDKVRPGEKLWLISSRRIFSLPPNKSTDPTS
jgi:DNA ligase-associated metallophosphoesterase